MCLYITGTIPPNGNVGEPGLKESLIPVWGSGRSAVNHFQHGNYWRSSFYAVLAISDVFLISSLWNAGGKLMIKGGAALLGRKSEQILVQTSSELLEHAPSIMSREAEDLVIKLSSSEFKTLGLKIGPAVQQAQIDGWFIKRVDKSANWFRREWGAMSIEAQEQALIKLGADMAPEFFLKDGMLFIRSVGNTNPKALSGTFWGAFVKGSYRMGTILNDIRPRNMGVNTLIFDPALDPVIKSIFHTGLYGATVPMRVILRKP